MSPRALKAVFITVFLVVTALSTPIVHDLAQQMVDATGEDAMSYLVLLIIYGPAFGIFSWFIFEKVD